MSDNWHNKYAQSINGTGRVIVQRGGGKALAWIAGIIAVALVVMIFVGGSALVYRSRSEKTFVNRMMTECDTAISATGALSRSGGYESATILSRIRANIHAIDVINDIGNTVKGGSGYYVSQTYFTNLYTIIDNYYYNLKLGNVPITENLNDLVTGLESLKTALAELK